MASLLAFMGCYGSWPERGQLTDPSFHFTPLLAFVGSYEFNEHLETVWKEWNEARNELITIAVETRTLR